MSTIFALELYKLIKKWPQLILVIVVSLIIPLYGAISVKRSFLEQYSYWARLSHDPNPYNFLVNKTAMFTSISIIIVIILSGLIIVSEEYKGKTITKLQTTVIGIRKILITKMLLILLISIICLVICFTVSYINYSKMHVKFSSLFSIYIFIGKGEILKCLTLYVFAIIKIIIFHTTLITVFGKYYYLPLILGLINTFLFFLNYLPYGIYYRTDVLGTLSTYIIYFNILTFFAAVVLAIYFFRENLLRKIAKFSSI